MQARLWGTLVYFAFVLGFLEWLRRRARVAPDVTRKAFFFATALWALPASSWLEHRFLAVGGYLFLTALAYLSFRFEWFAAIEDDGASLGSVFLPLSGAILLAWFWGERSYLAVAGMFAAGFGDTAAALVGRRTGSRKYRARGTERSMEGTLAMFFAVGISLAPLLALRGELGLHQAVAFALIGATVAACTEAVSIYSTDNLTVPVVTAAALATLLRFSQ